MMIDHASILIASITSASQLAREAFGLYRNAHFSLKAYGNDNHTSGDTRESTPAAEFNELTIYITTDHEPYEFLQGFMFGSDCSDEEIDIVLSVAESGSSRGSSRASSGVSRKHFSLCYNWDMKCFILVNHSKLGTGVRTTTGLRSLSNYHQSISLSSGDVILAGTAQMRITYPRRDDRSSNMTLFDSNWRKLHQKWQNAAPQASHLSLYNSDPLTNLPSMELELQKQIGSGTTSLVYKAVDASGKSYAVKMPGKSEHEQLILSEIRAMERLQHPNIINYFAEKVIVANRHLRSPYMVLEYAVHGSLNDCWRVLNFLQAETLFIQLFDAVRHSHSIGLAHQDIKPDNVLVASIVPGFMSTDGAACT